MKEVFCLQISQANTADLVDVSRLASLLWPDHTADELAAEARESLQSGRTAFFLARAGEQAVAFAQCAERRDYVEGTAGGPVGYLEGIYVLPEFRQQGTARALVQACEEWAKMRGCRQLASDCELNNSGSLAWHLRAGFTETNRVICFVKDIG